MELGAVLERECHIIYQIWGEVIYHQLERHCCLETQAGLATINTPGIYYKRLCQCFLKARNDTLKLSSCTLVCSPQWFANPLFREENSGVNASLMCDSNSWNPGDDLKRCLFMLLTQNTAVLTEILSVTPLSPTPSPHHHLDILQIPKGRKQN